MPINLYISDEDAPPLSRAKAETTNMSRAGFNLRLRYTLRENAYGFADGDR